MMSELDRIFFWKKRATQDLDQSAHIASAIDAIDAIAAERPPHVQLSEEYRQYMQSDEWKWIRGQKLRSCHYRCERCGRRRWLNVHHRHYRTFGREGMEDLEVVCQECHKTADAERRKQSKWRQA